ncbi:Hint domain-containing protein [Frigidibacter sp. MR17.24]|uniref:Hint domain-containing protein n=1 Tax=Frigidibacter sp. MR17.24 TaxID=3127345 RepID=UPI003012D731
MTLKYLAGHWWDGDLCWDGLGWSRRTRFHDGGPQRPAPARAAPPREAAAHSADHGGDHGSDRAGTCTLFYGARRPDCPVPCFTPGTLVTTVRGTMPIEALRPGDRVVTRDNGPQPVVWIGENFIAPDRLATTPGLAPIRIGAGSLGGGLPETDVVVSPRHRMLCGGDRALDLFGDTEVLVAARDLAGLPGVATDTVAAVTYLHLLFEQHQVVMADGVWSESFQPGDWMAEGMDSAQRTEILSIFPELADRPAADVYPAARRGLCPDEARMLVD